ncbi:MAG: class I SAM-dependent rRNA methyltransferase [Candidatus Omnitrophica bacterium]|nr:class I SAM-dependent rRNA methyltransferase [Candidatus Omnitrophota bacterium]
MKTLRCLLKKGKEKPLEGRHPWVFSGAIDQIDDGFETGDLIRVFSAENQFLGIGYLNPRSQIAIRMLAFEDISIGPEFFEKKISDAVALRQRFLPPQTNACRLINSEGDFLPGLVVDRYHEYLVVQFLTAGMDLWKEVIVAILLKTTSVRGIYEKDDTPERDWEGIPKRAGKLAGEEPPDFIEIEENGNLFLVDIHGGQKTGFFLDQRDNRWLVGRHSRGRRVLNCFAYTGGFGVYAAKGGADEVVCVESSETALNVARENFSRNNLSFTHTQFVKEDVFDYFRKSRQEFDMIILDPPAFCKNKQQIQQASRGYKDINLYAIRRLSPGGLLFTASCSSYISSDLFQKIVFGAAKDAHRNLRILQKTSHAFDHPINIYHPEGEYLKGLLCVID